MGNPGEPRPRNRGMVGVRAAFPKRLPARGAGGQCFREPGAGTGVALVGAGGFATMPVSVTVKVKKTTVTRVTVQKVTVKRVTVETAFRFPARLCYSCDADP